MIDFGAGFNWLTTLEALVAGAEISGAEYGKLLALALRWPTCACGELCKTLPRNEHGAPHDKVLQKLGSDFAGAVGFRDWTDALFLFRLIEHRTEQLLAQRSPVGIPQTLARLNRELAPTPGMEAGR